MKNREKILLEIIKFIVEERWEYKIILNEETNLEKDLKIFGDDAIEILIKYGKRFNVDISSIIISDYFSPEVAFSFFHENKKTKELKIKDLVNGVISGYLINCKSSR